MEKAFLATIVALFVLLVSISFVSASELTSGFKVTIDGIDYNSEDTIGIEGGETIPINVVFTATENAENVRMKVWIDGYRDDISEKTGRFELVYGSTYSKKFSLRVPSDIDPTEEYDLIVRLYDKTKDYEEQFSLKVQRESYNLNVLFVEAPQTATPGSTIGIDVVLKNWGMHDVEDVLVKASIADLGIERNVYFGDIDPLDECEYDDGCEGDRQDSVERRIYLTIPANAKAGTYNLEVKASNADSSDTVQKKIVVSAEGISEIFPGVTSKTIYIGETATFDLVIANSGNTLKVFTLVPEDVKGLIVEVEPVVSVPAGSSKTVKVSVKATESAEEGTHTVAINVNSGSELVKRAIFSANVEKGAKTRSSVFVLTIILAIVFIVLLIILIVLLTRKPAIAETEETSYY